MNPSHTKPHVHVHAHGEHAPNFAQANREHFDHNAAHYDQFPGAIELCRNCAHEALKAYPFKEGETEAMEFACGTGLVSKELVPHVKSILGVDISQGMVDQYNKRNQTEGIPLEKMHAIRCQLEGKEGELDGSKFDVIFCASAYHHFESINKITNTLTYFLKPGGVLIVLDGEKREFEMKEEYRHILPHAYAHGMEKTDIIHALEQAGLDSVSYEKAFDTEILGTPVTYFIAKGVKPQ